MKENYIYRSFLTVSKAIHILSLHFENIALPIRNSYFYDILVEKKFEIFRIKIISTTCKTPNGNYIANIRKSGGNQNGTQTYQLFNSKNCDYIFVETPEHYYLIPTDKIKTTRSISLCNFNDYILRDSSEVEQATVNRLVEGSIPSHADFD